MLSFSRSFLKSGSAGFHYLCESRYGMTNAPFFGLFSRDRDADSILSVSAKKKDEASTSSSTPATTMKEKEENSASSSSSSASSSSNTKNTPRTITHQVGNPQGFSFSITTTAPDPTSINNKNSNSSTTNTTNQHHPHHDEDYLDLFHPETHGSVLTLTPTQFKSACCYCRAAVALVGKVPNARDFLAGWAAAITSNADLVSCALQTLPESRHVDIFLNELKLKRTELTEKDREIVLRCFLIDVVTSVVRARGSNDLIGIEDFLCEYRDYCSRVAESENNKNNSNINDSDNSNNTQPEGKSTTKKPTFHSEWIDALMTEDYFKLMSFQQFLAEKNVMVISENGEEITSTSTTTVPMNTTEQSEPETEEKKVSSESPSPDATNSTTNSEQAPNQNNNNTTEDISDDDEYLIDHQNHEDSLQQETSSRYSVLRPIFQFSREQKVPDRIIAEIFTFTIQEIEVNEEKFSLIADGASVSHLQ